jgi:hypothetical protein
MKLPRHAARRPHELPSDRGFLELAGRDDSISLREAFLRSQYRLNRIRDEMDYYLVTTASADLDRERLRKFFTDQQDIWHDVSRQWVEFRKLDQAPPGGASVSPALGGASLPSGRLS